MGLCLYIYYFFQPYDWTSVTRYGFVGSFVLSPGNFNCANEMFLMSVCSLPSILSAINSIAAGSSFLEPPGACFYSINRISLIWFWPVLICCVQWRSEKWTSSVFKWTKVVWLLNKLWLEYQTISGIWITHFGSLTEWHLKYLTNSSVFKWLQPILKPSRNLYHSTYHLAFTVLC